MTLAMLVPDGNDWIPRELRELSDRIAQLEAGYSLDRATIGEGGLTIYGEGGLTVKTPDDVEVVRTGALPDAPRYNRPDGTRQQAFQLRRENGTAALELLEGAADNGTPYRQGLVIRDAAGAAIFAEDSDSGQGLARPWLHMGVWVDGYAIGTATQPTDRAEWNTQQVADAYRQHPRATVLAIVSSDNADTTGEVALFDENGDIVGAPLPVAANSIAYARLDIAWPTGWEFGSGGLFALKARRTAGTGKVGARGVSFVGRQS